jgi:hypothetical protein
MDCAEYLVTYGQSGDFSRFRCASPDRYQRGDRVIVRSPQGLEVGVVMCPVTSAHGHYLSERAAGELLRPVTEEDEQTLETLREQGRRIFDDARRLAGELSIPVEILDVDVLFEGRQAVLYHLRPENCDYRPLVRALSKTHDLLLTMQNLALPMMDPGGEEEHGCGRPDCGHGAGGCSSCSSGGCSAGSCGAGLKKETVTAYLAGLRQQMEHRARTPLV